MLVNYIKIRADFKYATKGRFFRTFLVREDIGLGELGELIVDIFGGTMEHFFMYSTKEKSYIPSSWIDNWDDMSTHQHESFKNKNIKDLPNNFIFIYDTGDGWDFDCKIYKVKSRILEIVTSFPKYGVLGRLKLKMNVPNGKTRIVLEGIERVEVSSFIEDGKFYRASYEEVIIPEGEEEKNYFSILGKALER